MSALIWGHHLRGHDDAAPLISAVLVLDVSSAISLNGKIVKDLAARLNASSSCSAESRSGLCSRVHLHSCEIWSCRDCRSPPRSCFPILVI